MKDEYRKKLFPMYLQFLPSEADVVEAINELSAEYGSKKGVLVALVRKEMDLRKAMEDHEA